MPTQTQKALLLTEIGKPLILSNTHPIPQPGPSQIQIRVTVAGLNPHDSKFRDHGIILTEKHLPYVFGGDVVGIVTAVGSSVDPARFAIGDRVFSQQSPTDGTQGGLQQYAVLDTDFSAKVPEGFSDDDAAELPVNAITDILALFDNSILGLSAPWESEAANGAKDKTLLIIGGGSNTGRFAVQLAAAAGIGRIVVVGGDEAQLKSFGATDVLDRHGSDDAVTQSIRGIVNDELVSALDCVNMPDKLHIGINALSKSKKGKLARLLPFGVPDETKIHAKSHGYEVIDVAGYPSARGPIGKPAWENLPQLLREGKLKPTRNVAVVDGLDVDKVNSVLDAYRDGKRVVKTHVHVS